MGKRGCRLAQVAVTVVVLLDLGDTRDTVTFPSANCLSTGVQIEVLGVNVGEGVSQSLSVLKGRGTALAALNQSQHTDCIKTKWYIH